MKAIKKFIENNLHWLILCGVAVLCALFLVFGTVSENGSVTLNGSDAIIEDYTKDFIEDANAALNRIMNEDKPTDQETIDASDEPVGQGFYVDIDTIISRIEADGNDDNGLKWQCSKYTGYLATGKREYNSVHTDYGPVNGKNVAEWLVKNYGFKYIDQPVKGAIGSGGFNTTYGHTALYLYSTGANSAMVNDANWTPLKVATHNMNISGWVWVVPGNYEPKKEEPTPTPSPVNPNQPDSVTYSYQGGDYFAKVLRKLGYDEGNLWGSEGSVKYYTKQLIEQNVLDKNGNVKIGVPFTLYKR